MLETSLQSSNLLILLWTALALGFVHTILGPDHYVPFVMMAKAQSWSRRRTYVITAICGVGHVSSSIVIAMVLIALGTAVDGWEQSSLAGWHEVRGDVAAWALIGVGAAYALWGLRRALRARSHVHHHYHGDGEPHSHEHDHHGDHVHVHVHEAARFTPWVLFTIFVFGPCESLIPLILAGWGLGGLVGAASTAVAFSVSTVATILLTVGLLLAGVDLIPLGRLERWTHAIAGLSLVACGGAIRFLGL